MSELIQQARELCENGHDDGYDVLSMDDCITQLCDALEEEISRRYQAECNYDHWKAQAEKAEEEVERLKTKLMLSEAREHPVNLFPELTPQQRAENAEIVALTIRAEKAKAERDTYKAALQNMRFAYINKDDPPHQFEVDALKEVDALIGTPKGE